MNSAIGRLASCVHPMTNFADRTIWTGDSLDILRGLNSSSVDLICLDPPFNCNRNHAAPVGSAAAGAAFKDTWALSERLCTEASTVQLFSPNTARRGDRLMALP